MAPRIAARPWAVRNVPVTYGPYVIIKFPSWSPLIGFPSMAMSDSEPNSPIFRSEQRPSIANRLVSLGLAAALVGTQMTWTAFLGWALVYFLR